MQLTVAGTLAATVMPEPQDVWFWPAMHCSPALVFECPEAPARMGQCLWQTQRQAWAREQQHHGSSSQFAVPAEFPLFESTATPFLLPFVQRSKLRTLFGVLIMSSSDRSIVHSAMMSSLRFDFALPIRSVSESHTRMVRAFALIRFWNGPKLLLNSAFVPALFFTGVVIVLPSKTSLHISALQ